MTDPLPPYLAIVREADVGSVLDVGGGTGELALLLARDGIDVTVVDPAAASIEVARRKAGADRVCWVEGTVADLPLSTFDLAVMTGNVAQVFLTDDDWRNVLTGVRERLPDGGHLVFETRRPQARAWERWASRPRTATLQTPDGDVRRTFTLLAVDEPFVSFRYDFELPDGSTLASASTLRFRDLPELEQSLIACGYTLDDVREAPDRPGLEYVVLARAR